MGFLIHIFIGIDVKDIRFKQNVVQLKDQENILSQCGSINRIISTLVHHGLLNKPGCHTLISLNKKKKKVQFTTCFIFK